MPGLLKDSKFKQSRLFRFMANTYDSLVYLKNGVKLLRQISQLSEKHELFFFFPHYSTGGAEMVHSEIVKIAANKFPVVFFTSNSNNTHYLEAFKDHALCIELIKYVTNNIWGKRIKRRFIKLINAKDQAILFGSNSKLFYQILPEINPAIYKIDLIHAFTHEKEEGAEKWSLPVCDKINKRIAINKNAKDNLIDQYKQNNLELLAERIIIIENGITIPEMNSPKKFEGNLKVVYAGRNGSEKRLHLIGKFANLCSSNKVPIEVVLAGPDLESGVDEKDRKFCTFTGEITDQRMMSEFYKNSHILLLVSSREGFPISIMEAMAHGLVVISTAVGGIPEHIKHTENGFFLNCYASEEKFLEGLFKLIKTLQTNRMQLEKVSLFARDYALNHFSYGNFKSLYASLFYKNHSPFLLI